MTRANHLIVLMVVLVSSRDGFAETTVEYGYRIVQSYPHSTEVFTQGLEFHDGVLYEGAGKRGQSMILTRRLDSVNPIKAVPLAPELFGEGITILNRRLYQLTWQSERVFVYDAENLTLTRSFMIQGEGWGLTNDGRRLIMSNGSNRLAFLDPETFDVVDRLEVTHHGRLVSNLNELEWIDGLIYANVWQSDRIVMIDPRTGSVTGIIQLDGLLRNDLRTARTEVLNGIAFDNTAKRLLITGKYWPYLYHIELISKGTRN